MKIVEILNSEISIFRCEKLHLFCLILYKYKIILIILYLKEVGNLVYNCKIFIFFLCGELHLFCTVLYKYKIMLLIINYILQRQKFEILKISIIFV